MRAITRRNNASSGVVVWAVIDPNTTIQTQWRSSHEVIEATTNPDAGTTGGGWTPEIGDPCNGKQTQIEGLTVQQFWSETACRCVREEDLDNVDVLVAGQDGFEPTVFRPSSSVWYADNAGISNWHFGLTGDKPFAGDFDGDGRTEFALLRYGSPTQMFTLDIASGVFVTHTFGASGDIAVPGDYDNPPDGRTDLAVWQASLGWRFRSSATGVDSTAVTWGVAGDIPVPGDYDDDGITDYAVVRPSAGEWFALLSTQPGVALEVPWVLTTGDIPVGGDFNGDGFADYAFWRPSTGTWYVCYSQVVSAEPTGKCTFAYSYPWGATADVPVGRDWDGDWSTDLIVFRPSTGHWFVVSSSDWTGADLGVWGTSGDIPIGQTSTFYEGE